MPLEEMSLNIQEAESGSQKRTFDEFSEVTSHKDSQSVSLHPAEPVLPPMNHHHLQVSPSGSPELTEAASSTPARMSPDPSTPSKNATTTTTGKPAASAATLAAKSSDAPKRRKLTPAEKEAKEKEAAEKKKKREEEEAERKKKKEEEEIAKAARMKEREEQRKQKAEKERLKLEEKEAKKRKIQEEKDKEARKQPKLKSFFGAPATPKKIKVGEQASHSPRHNSPGAAPASSETTYEKMFQPFFLKEHTTLAELGARINQETRETKLAILDDFIDGKRSIERAPRFNLEDFLTLPKDPKRGQVSHPPVKHIMHEFFKSDSASGSSMGEASRTAQDARAKLAKVPMKIIAFAEDVRPPYYGTATWKSFEAGERKLQQLAYNPMDQSLLKLDYGYDSEAEWQEDEEGEDLDLEDDEEDADDEDDMDGFLDDSEDLGPARVMAMNAMEPHCSGLHFEDAARQGCSQETHGFKLEMILGHENYTSTVDPWSSEYWAPEPKKQVAEKGSSMAPPPAPANAFAALGAASASTTNAAAKVVKPDIMEEVKKSILANKALSKVGIIDFVFQQFRDNATRTEVKNTIELVAERKKGTGKVKEWDLKPGHELVS